jgi:hypothetical protein
VPPREVRESDVEVERQRNESIPVPSNTRVGLAAGVTDAPRYTNRSDHAPRNIFALTGAAITLLKRISKSPTRAIEMVQDNRGKAVALIAGDLKTHFL